jgi:hypothetical protein
LGGCRFTTDSCNCHFVCGGPWGGWYPDGLVWCPCHLTSLTGEGERLPGVAELWERSACYVDGKKSCSFSWYDHLPCTWSSIGPHSLILTDICLTANSCHHPFKKETMLTISLFVSTVVHYSVFLHSCSCIYSVVQDSW